jgi:hypothetical protein
MDASEAEKLEDKATATLLFKSTYYDEMEMTIDRVSEAADGRCVVVFSAKRSLAEMLSLRAADGRGQFTSCSGLYIPEKAVYFDDNENGPYIYLLTGSRAEKVAVEILGRPRTATSSGTAPKRNRDSGGLRDHRPGEELYDGKVVKG